jgi:hypothetical protein
MASRAAIAAASALLLASCSRGGGREARERLEARDRAARPAPFDWSRPAAALAMTADEAAARMGSFDFTASVSWAVARGGGAPAAGSPAGGSPTGAEPLRVRASERHEVRQLAGGDFHVLAEIDPGTWQGAETGKEITFVGGATWARGRYAPFRERPTDRGQDARRFRDESFRLAGDLSALFGPALAVEPRGDASALGRPARRFALSLAKGGLRAQGQPDEAAPERAGGPGGPHPPGSNASDPDTRRRVDFLEGRAPLALQGEMLLDAESGVPLQVRMKGAFGEKDDPRLRADVELEARITGWGSMVGPVVPPKGALPDDRKPRGVARALEQAGLRKRGEEKAEEPPDEQLEGQ